MYMIPSGKSDKGFSPFLFMIFPTEHVTSLEHY